MPIKQIIFLSVVFVLLLAWLLRMITKNQLRDSYAVLWIGVILCIPASILLYPLISRVGGLIGFMAPVNFSFVIGFIVLFIICLHFSAQNSSIHRILKNMVQKIALMEEELKQIKKAQETSKK